jgi:GTP-binding protein
MRREGFEISVSPPRVIFKRGATASEVLEPIEEVTVDVDPEFTGTVNEKMSRVKGEMKSFDDSAERARLVFHVPTRGLLGYPAEFKNDTHGQGTLTYSLVGYEPYKGPIDKSRKGSILSTAAGETTAYSLRDVEARGRLFVGPGTAVYPGMIIGEHSRDVDCEVNPVKAKALTNMRAAGKEEAIRLTPIKEMGLEKMLSYIQDDEVIEVTPSALRVRKKELDATKRRNLARRGASVSSFEFEEEGKVASSSSA